MKNKRVLSLILSFILIISSLSVTSYAGNKIYDGYTVVNGTINKLTTNTIYVNDVVEVVVMVDFDTNNLSQVVAFDLIGSYSNLTLTDVIYMGDAASSDVPDSDNIDNIANLGDGSPELAEPFKTNKSTIIDQSKDGKISYTAISFPDSTFITEDAELGKAQLVKFKFKAKASGTAYVKLTDCYLRADYNYDDNDHRSLVCPNLSFTIQSNGGGGGGSRDDGPSLPPIIITPPEDDKRKYADISKDEWFYDNIDVLYEYGFINGTGVEEDGAIVISPDANITRQEAAKLSVNALRLDVINGVAGFSDDSYAADWAKPYIYTAAANERKLIKGYPEDNTFRPFNNITRAEFATIIMNTFDFELLESYDLSQFKDAEDITWAAPYIASLVKAGIVKGYADGCFHPNKYITRSEAFVMMYRALEVFDMIKK